MAHLQGDSDRARLLLIQVHEATQGPVSPDLLALRDQTRGLLRNLERQAIGSIREVNQQLLAQRSQVLEGNETRADESRVKARLNEQFLDCLQSFIDEGSAVTIDEALYQMERERNAERQVVSYAELPRDPEERRTVIEELQRNGPVRTYHLSGETLEVPDAIAGRRGSYEPVRVVIGRLGGVIRIANSESYVFPASNQERVVVIRREIVESSHLIRGRDFYRDTVFGGGSRRWLNAEHRDPDLWAVLGMARRDGLERLTDPEQRRGYLIEMAETLRHREGSYAMAATYLEEVFGEQFERAAADLDMEKASERMEELAASGELARRDRLAARAWSNYSDMLDPAGEVFNMADESIDKLQDELIITPLTFIPGIGVGGRVGQVVKATRAVQLLAEGVSVASRRLLTRFGPRIAARGARLAYAGVRGGVATVARVPVEAAVMNTGSSAIMGQPPTAEGVAHTAGTLAIFHGVGGLFGVASRLVGGTSFGHAVGRWAAPSLARRAALRTGQFGLQQTTMAGTATAMTDESEGTLLERFLAEGARMLYMTALGPFAHSSRVEGRFAVRPESREQLRMRVIQESRQRGASLEEAVSFAREIVPSGALERPGKAGVVPINQLRRWAEIRSQHGPQSATFDALTQRIRGAVVADTPMTGPGLEGLRVVDHHGPFATPDGKNSTMKLIDMMEEALTESRGNIDRAIQRLNIREVTTDNLADGGWCVWIARNQGRILSDPNLRALIRKATHFEDFTAFGSNYSRTDPAVELQAAIFSRYNEILQENGITGSDRFPPERTQAVLDEAMTAIDQMVGNPAARSQAAQRFWSDVDAATQAARGAVIRNASVEGEIVFFDMEALKDFGTFTQWLAVPQAHAENLQVTVDGGMMIVAIPNGRELPSGRGLLSVVEAVQEAEAARARELGLDPTHWFGKDNVILPNPARGGSLLTPAELSEILRNPADPSAESTRPNHERTLNSEEIAAAERRSNAVQVIGEADRYLGSYSSGRLDQLERFIEGEQNGGGPEAIQEFQRALERFRGDQALLQSRLQGYKSRLAEAVPSEREAVENEILSRFREDFRSAKEAFQRSINEVIRSYQRPLEPLMVALVQAQIEYRDLQPGGDLESIWFDEHSAVPYELRRGAWNPDEMWGSIEVYLPDQTAREIVLRQVRERAGVAGVRDEGDVVVVTLSTGDEVPLRLRTSRLSQAQIADLARARETLQPAFPELARIDFSEYTEPQRLAVADSLVNDYGWRYEDLAKIFTAEEIDPMLSQIEGGAGRRQAASGEN